MNFVVKRCRTARIFDDVELGANAIAERGGKQRRMERIERKTSKKGATGL